MSLPSGVPQVLPRGTSEPDSAAGHTADHSGPGLRPRLAGSQTIPVDIKRARTECSGAAVRFVNCALCYLREHKQFSLMFSISVPALIFLCSLSAAYRGQRARKRVAEDKSKAKFEAFIVQFQAGEDDMSWNHLSNTI